MPNRRECYKDMEKYRKTCNAQNKRYYAKTALYPPNGWTVEQDKKVLEHSITDFELSKIIGHSVKAIQIRRFRLKRQLEKNS